MKDLRIILKKNLRLSLPILISFLLGFVGLSIADTVMVGKLGPSFLAASSFSNSICAIFITFSIGASVSITPLFASASDDPQKGFDLLKNSVVINIFLGLILTAGCYVLISQLDRLGQPADVIEIAAPYIKIIGLTIFLSSIKTILLKYLDGHGKVRTTMFFSIIVFFCNIFLNYALINGKFGFPKLDLIGAGIATLISRILEIFLPVSYIYMDIKRKKITRLFNQARISFSEIFRLLKLAIPSGFHFTLERGFLLILNMMIGWCGTLYLAAHAVSINIVHVTLLFPLSISIASSIIIGGYSGFHNHKMIKKTANIGYGLLQIFFIVNSFLLSIFLNSIMEIYQVNSEIRAIIYSTFPAIITLQVAQGLNIMGISLLRGLQDTFIPVILSTFSLWIIGFGASYFLGFVIDLKLLGIWAGASIGFAISAALLHLRFRVVLKKLRSYSSAILKIESTDSDT